MNQELIRQVKEQMEIADSTYKDSIENIDPQYLLKSTNAIKKAKAHALGIVIEQYLKALIILKVGTWTGVKKIGHGLLGLYKELDDKGKEILLRMVSLKPKKNMSQSSSVQDRPLSDNKNKLIPKTIENGQYDGDYDFPEQLTEEDFDCSYFESLLKKVNVPSLRYSNSPYNLDDKDLLNLLGFARNMHALSKIARGTKKQINKR